MKNENENNKWLIASIKKRYTALQQYFLSIEAYTMMELVLVLLIVAVLAAVAIPAIGGFITTSKIAATEKEMAELARAISGDPEDGFYGFANEVGDFPTQLAELYNDSGSSPYNPYTRTGWNGPYVDNADRDGDATADILQDSWGNSYVYNTTAGTITSYGPDGATGGGDDIVVALQ